MFHVPVHESVQISVFAFIVTGFSEEMQRGRVRFFLGFQSSSCNLQIGEKMDPGRPGSIFSPGIIEEGAAWYVGRGEH